MCNDITYVILLDNINLKILNDHIKNTIFISTSITNKKHYINDMYVIESDNIFNAFTILDEIVDTPIILFINSKCIKYYKHYNKYSSMLSNTIDIVFFENPTNQINDCCSFITKKNYIRQLVYYKDFSSIKTSIIINKNDIHSLNTTNISNNETLKINNKSKDNTENIALLYRGIAKDNNVNFFDTYTSNLNYIISQYNIDVYFHTFETSYLNKDHMIEYINPFKYIFTQWKTYCDDKSLNKTYNMCHSILEVIKLLKVQLNTKKYKKILMLDYKIKLKKCINIDDMINNNFYVGYEITRLLQDPNLFIFSVTHFEIIEEFFKFRLTTELVDFYRSLKYLSQKCKISYLSETKSKPETNPIYSIPLVSTVQFDLIIIACHSDAINNCNNILHIYNYNFDTIKIEHNINNITHIVNTHKSKFIAVFYEWFLQKHIHKIDNIITLVNSHNTKWNKICISEHSDLIEYDTSLILNKKNCYIIKNNMLVDSYIVNPNLI